MIYVTVPRDPCWEDVRDVFMHYRRVYPERLAELLGCDVATAKRLIERYAKQGLLYDSGGGAWSAETWLLPWTKRERQ